ncbi:Clp protease N-terminal domain-containing protein [Streptomyces sp. NPDC088400]|uniref:Clp protease N-terminal domain-containing protein n=1 Tax=Streptomyces sp. NPDC088400 TaxID=3365861 RepID=UPI0038107C31
MTRERPTPAVNADVEDAPSVEIESDVMETLVRMLRRAARLEIRTVGTEHLLFALVRGDTEAGAALAPGVSDAGALSGVVAAREDGVWVHHEHADDGAAPAPEDEVEVTAAWREAQWLAAENYSRSLPDGWDGWPEPSEALRSCLLRALRLAREEGTPGVRCRHVARVLLDLPGSRAVEALKLRRVDLTSAASALDAQAVAEAGTPGPESRTVVLLRRAGLLGERGTWWTRALMSWMSRAAGDGSPVLLAVRSEANRQAVRCGRREVEPVDLLLAIQGLDRALTVAGRSLPEGIVPLNTAAALMRSHGVRPSTLIAGAIEAEPAPVTAEVPYSTETERVIAAARLLAAEHGSRAVGTVHLLAALLADGEGDGAGEGNVAGEATVEGEGNGADKDESGNGSLPSRLLREGGADPAELLRQLVLRLGG